MSSDLKKYILHFLKNKGHASKAFDLKPLPGDGSKRVFWRISRPKLGASFVVMANPPIDSFTKRENFAYVMIGHHLHKKKIAVPEIHQYDLERGWFIMEDLGEKNLQEMVSSSDNPLPLYEKVLEHLFRLQLECAKDFDLTWCCQTHKYDRTVMRQYESNYFREAFLCNYLGLKREWPELEAPFDHLAEIASEANSRFFLHRDFQSRNIIISKGNIGIIDWQGGRLGPLGYDLASLIIDPYTDLSPQHRILVFESYLRLIREYNTRWIETFERYYSYLAIQRNLQILGAFSYLTRIRNKRFFEAYIPAALRSLHELLIQVNDPRLSPLKYIVNDIQGSTKGL